MPYVKFMTHQTTLNFKRTKGSGWYTARQGDHFHIIIRRGRASWEYHVSEDEWTLYRHTSFYGDYGTLREAKMEANYNAFARAALPSVFAKCGKD